ncbi:hypothetical protein JZ751_020927 [Albula glossodonta]|uniref:Uncharacterized protein n=1 Tax=Albula glossodonta TaxID=121402 RepID=A0A8T2PGQ5_9TELE|nr:hypothetical protein JZ751_020927 [Albula glossodonta]
MPGGSLHSLLYETQLHPEFPLPLRLRILLDVAEGLSHLHAIPVSHQALKPTNVLLDPQHRAKLCDFGQLMKTVSPNEVSMPCIRDLVYLSPETLKGEKPSKEADMYSFGMLFWETMNRRSPYEKVRLRHPRELLSWVENGAQSGTEGQLLSPEVPQAQALEQLLRRCWSSDPCSRPTAVDCMLELRKVVANFDPESLTRAALQLKERKERALIDCKAQPGGEMKMEINNLEIYGGYKNPKSTGMKMVPIYPVTASPPIPLSPSPNNIVPKNASPPTQGRSSPPVTCCRECATLPLSVPGTPCSHISRSPRQRSGSGRVSQRQSPSPPSPLSPPSSLRSSASSGTLDLLKQGPLGQLPVSCRGKTRGNPFGCLSGQSCHQILRERREVIIRGMTEGRLNNLLDVLLARRALNREAYELITAALTLDARTRSLLDTCLCLGEAAATLVVSTLGLVSMVTAHSPCHLCSGREGELTLNIPRGSL